MIKTIFDTNFNNKRVLVRVDYNEPITEAGKVGDTTRILESLGTIDKIIDDGGIPILMSHLGRPKGVRNMKFSLKPVAEYMINYLGYEVIFAKDCIGQPALDAIQKAEVGNVVLLENLRFHKEEEKNDLHFAGKLAALADVYVNDAFGTAHRSHASTAAIAGLFSEKFAGKLLLDEIEYLGKSVTNPQKPFVAILGGAKISGKIDVIRNLLDKCDSIIIGGGMMFIFLKAMGYEIGHSIVEESKIDLAKDLMAEAKSRNTKLILPVDVVIADSFSNNANSQIVKISEFPHDWMGMDIGPETVKLFSDEILKGKTVVWNGPMGVFEMDKFAAGTFAIGKAMSEATLKGAVTIVGGGDSISAITKMNLKQRITHVSTGGGASLEYLEGKTLPGIAALEV